MFTINSKKMNAVVVVTLALTALTLSACQNTMYGAGKDMENAGESVQESSGGPRN